jgi:hypothetical protein
MVCNSSYEILGLSETAQNGIKQVKEVQIDLPGIAQNGPEQSETTQNVPK